MQLKPSKVVLGCTCSDFNHREALMLMETLFLPCPPVSACSTATHPRPEQSVCRCHQTSVDSWLPSGATPSWNRRLQDCHHRRLPGKLVLSFKGQFLVAALTASGTPCRKGLIAQPLFTRNCCGQERQHLWFYSLTAMIKRQFGEIMKNVYWEDTESHTHYLTSTTFDHVMWAAEFTHIMYSWYSEGRRNAISKFLTFLQGIRLTLDLNLLFRECKHCFNLQWSH